MKILSFDVGIKNLAWSIVDENDKVIDFNIINLNEPKPCKKCSKPSFYFKFLEIEMIYCCKGHAQDFDKPSKIKEKTIEELCETLVEKLNDEFENREYDKVVIENQPSFRAPRMKSIQCMIMTFFVMKNKEVKFQNPCVTAFGKKFKKYKEKKDFSIKLVKEIVSFKTMEKINKFKKRDDICDSILHGIVYNHKGQTPEKIKKLL